MSAEEKPVYYADGIEPVRRSSPGELFLVTIEARPAPGSEKFGQMGGSFVNCWVNADDLCTAERRAVALIEADGWRPHRFEEWSIVSRETYTDWKPLDEDGPDLRELFEQALIDGELCVFNTWPLDAPDAGAAD
jgi:hypothetical protein